MKLEKRGDGGPVEPVEETNTGKKPVVVYIMILFIAAFLLMAWSFASHQRSNTEALGRLQSSVGVMQEVQDLQEQVIQLQEELAEVKEQYDNMEDQWHSANDALNNSSYILQQTQEAMEWFWQLEEAWLKEDFEMCRTIMAEMEKNDASPLTTYLTPLASDHYLEIKEAVKAAEARTAE